MLDSRSNHDLTCCSRSRRVATIAVATSNLLVSSQASSLWLRKSKPSLSGQSLRGLAPYSVLGTQYAESLPTALPFGFWFLSLSSLGARALTIANSLPSQGSP